VALAATLPVVLVVVFFPGRTSEQIVLVNDSTLVLRLDNCPFDGVKVQPGVSPSPIDVTTRIGCPVYANRDAAYLGCLVLRRESRHTRRVLILASIQHGISISRCHAIDDP